MEPAVTVLWVPGKRWSTVLLEGEKRRSEEKERREGEKRRSEEKERREGA
jgi:hypothetical protein